MERLTRITLLLTKATFLFMPVSLTTAYFSTQLTNAAYTVKQYWVAFAVTLFVSYVALAALGVFSQSVQSAVVWREMWDGSKRMMTWLSADGEKVKDGGGNLEEENDKHV